MPAATTSVEATSITSTELSDKLQKQNQQEQQREQKQRKLLTAVAPNKYVQIQQQQRQHKQQQHKHHNNLIACAIATTPKTTTKTIAAPTATITKKTLKLYNSRGSRSGSSSRSILTLLLSLMLYNHVFQTAAAAVAAVTTIVSSPTLENFEILQQPQYNHNSNNSAMLQYHQHLYNNQNLFIPFQLPLQPKANSNSNNNTLKSFSITDRLKAETEMNQMPVFDFGMPRNITGRSGQTEAIIKCRVDVLNDKSVSWIRKRDLHILTVGTATYTSDKRFEVSESKNTREWALHVKMPQLRDSGIYECQVNTEPKMSMAFQLNIIEISPDAKAIISGPPDLYFKVGSAIILNCIVEQPSVKDIGPIYWYRYEHMITPFDADNDDNALGDTVTFRDGDDVDGDTVADENHAAIVSDIAADDRTQELSNDILTQDFAIRIAMESQLGDTLKSRLRISNAKRADTGNYTCQPTTASSASVMVHVINDENPAAMQKSNANALYSYKLPAAGASFVTTIVVTTVCCLVYHHLIVTVAVGAVVVVVDAIAAVTVFGSATAANLLVSITDSQVCLKTFVVAAATTAAGAAAVVVIVVSVCDVVLVVIFSIFLIIVFLGNFFAKAISFLFATT